MENTGTENKKRFYIDVIKYRWVWLILTLAFILPGIIAMGYLAVTDKVHHSPLKLGIDFTGGTITQYGVSQNVSVDQLGELREQLTKSGIESPVIQTISDKNVSGAENPKNTDMNTIVSIRTKFIDEKSNDINTIKDVMIAAFNSAQLIQVTSVGPTLGSELFRNSLIAMALAFLGIVFYLSFRFQFDYAIIAIMSLFVDVLFLTGIFAILGIFFNVHIDALFITAILTAIGFSVHDNIIIFDRIRENVKLFSKKNTYSQIVNMSVNQTLARSINTSMTTLLTLLALFFFGGATTKDFVLAMIIGIAMGAYLSIFFACTIIAWWHEMEAEQA